MGRPRWRRVAAQELPEVRERLATWPCAVGGAARHVFPLDALDRYGIDVVRIAERQGGWAAAIALPGRVLVPCGDASVLRAVGSPVRRWRLLVGDAAAADALILSTPDEPGMRVHVQRFLTTDPALTPAVGDLPDPGLRLAGAADIQGLAELAVQLHIDDKFGPDPGKAGLRGYAARLQEAVERDGVFCAGPIGAPLVKVERSVCSDRWGVQLAGIVVRPDQRGRGLGSGAVAAAVRQSAPGTPVSLHVRADNLPALRTYSAVGFADREEWRMAVRP